MLCCYVEMYTVNNIMFYIRRTIMLLNEIIAIYNQNFNANNYLLNFYHLTDVMTNQLTIWHPTQFAAKGLFILLSPRWHIPTIN